MDVHGGGVGVNNPNARPLWPLQGYKGWGGHIAYHVVALQWCVV